MFRLNESDLIEDLNSMFLLKIFIFKLMGMEPN